MDEIITEQNGSILRVELNRPAKRNAMTSSMYAALADIFNDAAKDECTRVVLWHGAGDSFSAGNDVEDFLRNPPGPGDSPQARLMNTLVDFDKPLIAAVQGAAIGGGTTMLTHCDFVYAGQSAKFQHQSWCGAGIWIELLRSGKDRAHSGGGVDFVGNAFRCPTRRGIGIRYPDRIRSEPAVDGDRNGAEAGSKACRCAAS